MAMKRSPTPLPFFPAALGPALRPQRAWKYCLKAFGSVVLPDFDDTMNRVFFGSIRLSNDFTCAGTVYGMSFPIFQPGAVALLFAWAVLVGLCGAGGILFPSW